MWTRKAAIMLAGGISLILIGMMISNFLLMIIGLTFIAFISVNGWLEGHSELEITRFVPHSNVYKGDLVEVTLNITNKSYKRTQQLEIFDNVPHEMKLKQGINQMRLNLGPGQSTKIEYKLRCPLRGHYSLGPISVRYRDAFDLFVTESKIENIYDITVFPQVREIEDAMLKSDVPKMYTGATTLRTPGPGMEFYSLREYLPGDPLRSINWKAFARTGDMMVNQKTRDAVTDVFIILDTRDVTRIGTVLKNPLEMGTIAAASISNHFNKWFRDQKNFKNLAFYYPINTEVDPLPTILSLDNESSEKRSWIPNRPIPDLSILQSAIPSSPMSTSKPSAILPRINSTSRVSIAQLPPVPKTLSWMLNSGLPRFWKTLFERIFQF